MNSIKLRLCRSSWGESFFLGLVSSCACVALFIVCFILATTLWKGFDRIDVSYLVSPSNALGTEGGIAYQLLGSAILLLTAAAVVTPFAFGIAIVDHFARSLRIKSSMRSLLHLLNATPSILFGILGFIFFVNMCGWDKSWLGGGLILALMILPTVTLAVIHRLETVPREYIDTASALGLTPDHTIRSILIPYGFGGLLTGIVMGVARAAGETAPIMFTAVVFYGATLPSGVAESPVLALPYHIFNLAQDVLDPSALTGAWATSFVLICFVLTLSLLIAPLRSRGHEEAKQ